MRLRKTLLLHSVCPGNRKGFRQDLACEFVARSQFSRLLLFGLKEFRKFRERTNTIMTSNPVCDILNFNCNVSIFFFLVEKVSLQ